MSDKQVFANIIDSDELQAEMPHGGFEHPGYGKDLSMYGMEHYTRIKHVTEYHGYEG